MADTHAEFGADQGGGNGRVDVAVDENEVRLALDDDRLQNEHDSRSLLGVAAGTDSQVEIGFGDFKLLEKDVGHGRIVVLSGMDESLTNAGLRGQGPQHRSRLHEIRARTNYVKDVHMNRASSKAKL